MVTQKAAPPRPETNAQVLAQFVVHDPRLIRSTLRELAHNFGMLCLVATRPVRAWVVTRVRTVDAQHVELEVNTDAHRRAALLNATDLYLVAELESIKVQVQLKKLQPKAGSDETMVVEIPTLIHRIQRRDGFRVRPVAPMRMVCNVRDGNGGFQPWPVVDASVIGLALRAPPGTATPKPGDQFSHATLELEADDLIPVSLLVRRTWTIGEELDSGLVVGCEFQHLDAVAERRLQVVITEIERRFRR